MEISGAELLAGFLVSTVGFGFFLYGKKQHRWPQLAGGLAMMLVPYFGVGALVTWSVGAASVAGIWIAARVGW